MKNKIFFPNLDGLRFLAFLLVFWQHSSTGLFMFLKSREIANDSQNRFFYTGGYGVSFFFVLSGFLITFLLLQEVKENGAINIKAFYVIGNNDFILRVILFINGAFARFTQEMKSKNRRGLL